MFEDSDHSCWKMEKRRWSLDNAGKGRHSWFTTVQQRLVLVTGRAETRCTKYPNCRIQQICKAQYSEPITLHEAKGWPQTSALNLLR
jgi:hypothetical protein